MSWELHCPGLADYVSCPACSLRVIALPLWGRCSFNSQGAFQQCCSECHSQLTRGYSIVWSASFWSPARVAAVTNPWVHHAGQDLDRQIVVRPGGTIDRDIAPYQEILMSAAIRARAASVAIKRQHGMTETLCPYPHWWDGSPSRRDLTQVMEHMLWLELVKLLPLRPLAYLAAASSTSLSKVLRGPRVQQMVGFLAVLHGVHGVQQPILGLRVFSRQAALYQEAATAYADTHRTFTTSKIRQRWIQAYTISLLEGWQLPAVVNA